MLFFDPACARPYDDFTLTAEPLGGAEATLIRVARGLGRMMVMQRGREQASIAPGPNATQHWPIDWTLIPADGPIVVNRNMDYALHIRRMGARGRVFLWVHDLCDHPLSVALPVLAQEGIELIAVSHWHRRQILAMGRASFGDQPTWPVVHVVHNAIDDDLAPGGETDADKLVFNASPHKGLDVAIRCFRGLRARHPRLRLHIANPGYFPTQAVDEPGVYVEGALPHPRLMASTRDAYCLFSPNTAYPETFGLIYAEAAALGVPSLAHPIGAVPEVLGDPAQLVDCLDEGAVIARFESWLDHGPPKARGRDEFRLATVVPQWRALLEGSA